jgi:sugar phosphate isomerase/epimerase
MIYISTGLIKNLSIEQSINYLSENGINNIELSGGEHDPDIYDKLTNFKTKINFMLHNYFPPPKKPFTLNLATLNEEIYATCKEHIINSIRISAKLEIPYYSFHAGFLIDPNPKELGKNILPRKLNNEKIATDKFLERLNFLSIEAKKEGVKLLIENNVINKQNYDNFKANPLMMTSIKQTELLIKDFPSDVNILLDLAHLKVSAKTLNFSAPDYLNQFDDRIKAYHISDNGGEFDTNDLITADSWFWNYIKKDKDYFTFEINTLDIEKIHKQIKILKNFIN